MTEKSQDKYKEDQEPKETVQVATIDHLKIEDVDTGEILVDRRG